MTSTSQNGWTLLERPTDKIATFTVTGTDEVRLPIRVGDVATVLLYVAEQFHKTVEPLHPGWCWGFAARLIRGSTTMASNHASATAIDLNAPAHPLGTNPANNFTDKQIAAIHAIITFCDGVVRWGGDYSGRKDGMHFEIVAGSSRVAALALKIRKAKEAATPTKSVSKPLGPDSPYKRQVMLYQHGLNAKIKAGLVEDGAWGPKTTAASKKFKALSGDHLLVADKANPVAGKRTVTALGLKWSGK